MNTTPEIPMEEFDLVSRYAAEIEAQVIPGPPPDNFLVIMAIVMGEALKDERKIYGMSKREAVLARLTGFSHTKSMPPELRVKLWHWLKPWYDEAEGHWHIGDKQASYLRIVWDEVTRNMP